MGPHSIIPGNPPGPPLVPAVAVPTIHTQHTVTPARTFVSRGVSPVPVIDLSPPDLASVSPIRPQHTVTPTRSFISRGVSPVPLRGVSPSVPLIDLLPPDIASWFSDMDTQGCETQPQACTQSRCPIPSTRAISVAGSESENERGKPPSRFRSRPHSPVAGSESENEHGKPPSRFRSRPRSPQYVPETQEISNYDFLVRICLFSSIYSLNRIFQTASTLGPPKTKRRKVSTRP